MIAHADNVIRIESPTKELADYLRIRLQWPNPDFIKKQELGKNTWNTPRDIILWQRSGNDMIVPFGMLQELKRLGVIVSPSEHLVDLERCFWGKVGNLYDYQIEALKSAILARNGVLVAPCGSGKTQIGIAIMAACGYRALWLTHTHELLKQSMSRAKQYLDVPMGTITDGKIDASQGITFATVQTMSKIDLSLFKDFWDVIIIDECHRCVGTPTRITMFWKVLSSLSARYKIGLTATPKRGDGMEQAMYALLGPKFYEISKDQVKDTTVPLNVLEPIETHWEPDYEEVLEPDGTLNYTSLITNCTTSPVRNAVVANAINSAARFGPVMVLSERVAHLEILAELCDYSKGILSTAKKNERKTMLQDVRDGKIRVLFATYAIAKEGLDIPCLEHLVMASPIKDTIAVTQSAGRVMRKFGGKEFGTIWDFEDDMSMLKNWLKKRLTLYRRLE